MLWQSRCEDFAEASRLKKSEAEVQRNISSTKLEALEAWNLKVFASPHWDLFLTQNRQSWLVKAATFKPASCHEQFPGCIRARCLVFSLQSLGRHCCKMPSSCSEQLRLEVLKKEAVRKEDFAEAQKTWWISSNLSYSWGWWFSLWIVHMFSTPALSDTPTWLRFDILKLPSQKSVANWLGWKNQEAPGEAHWGTLRHCLFWLCRVQFRSKWPGRCVTWLAWMCTLECLDLCQGRNQTIHQRTLEKPMYDPNISKYIIDITEIKTYWDSKAKEDICLIPTFCWSLRSPYLVPDVAVHRCSPGTIRFWGGQWATQSPGCTPIGCSCENRKEVWNGQTIWILMLGKDFT